MNARHSVLAALASLATSGLVAQSAPPPPPRPVGATDYYRLTSVAAPALAPDGRRVAFTVTTVVEDKDRRHSEIWLAPVDGTAPAARLTSPVHEASNPVWSPDGSLLAFSSRREGAEENIWFLRMNAPGEAFQIKGVHGMPAFSPDGKWLLYGWRGAEPDSVRRQNWRNRVSPAAITRGPDPARFDGRVYTSLPFKGDERGYLPPRETVRPNHLYLVPLDGGEPRQLTTGELSANGPDWSPDGREIVFVRDSTEPVEIRDQTRQDLYVLTVAGGAIRRLTTSPGPDVSPAWSPDGRSIAYVCSKGRGEPQDVCVIPATGRGQPVNLTEEWAFDPGDPTWAPDGKSIYFSTDVRGNAHLFVVPAAGGPVRQVTTGERQLRGFAMAGGRWLAYSASDVTHPSELHVAQLQGASVRGERRLSSFNDSLMSQLAVIPADTFWYSSVGGLKIQGWLMRPHGYQPGRTYPLVLSIHGGPHSNYGNVYFHEFQVLAGQGYWVLFTNPRGSSGYGHGFTYAIRGRWGVEDYQDLLKSVDVVIARGGVDTTRMAVLGGSYGGFMTNWIVGHTNRFRVAQTDRSIFNWYSWYGSSDAQGLTDYEFFGAPWEQDSVYTFYSPMTYTNAMRTPMLIVHSEDDFRTPITDAEQLFVMLRKRGIPSELVRYPRSFHGLSRTGPPWLLVDRLERIRTWFEHWLGTGDKPPAHAAGSQ